MVYIALNSRREMTGQLSITFPIQSEWTHVHKLTGTRLRIKKLYDDVASCYTENPTYQYHDNGEVSMVIDVIVCSTENLIEIPKNQ